MASTPNKKSAPSVGKSNKSPERSPQPQSKTPDKKKSQGSMGLSLLMIAIGTSLVGLGGLGYLFYQELLGSSQREVDRASEAQTRQIEGKLANVRQSVGSVATAAKSLALQAPKPKNADLYQKLVLESLQSSDVIAGMGIAQNENQLFVSPKPASPYVWTEQSGLKPEVAGQKLPAPNDKLLAASRPELSANPQYKAAIAKGKASWSEPYSVSGKSVITYFAPIGDPAKPMGMVQADAIASNILAIANTASAESKLGFVVIGSSGKVITASDTFASSQAQNPAITESLNALAQQSKAKPAGITQTGGHLWAYRKIEGSDLLVATYLPESEITNKLMVLVGGAALGISAILAIAILGFVSSLQKRLQPLTAECDRFLTEQGTETSEIGGRDEIEHLSLFIKNAFQKVKTNEFALRNELAQNPPEATAQVEQSFAETELMEAEVGDLLDVVSSMEEGDLTMEAQVNDRATGLVADTLNRLREKLIEIISSVLGTAQQVAQGASDLEELARTVVLNTAEQAESVAQGQALTEQVAAIATRSSEQVNVANQSLQEVRDTVASGQTAINTLTDSIVVLQTGSAQIVQRMKTLGEFVGLAEQFVQDQGQIASLTQVLALNATLVAARAAEQKDPKQFAGVAREFEAIAGQVNDLATQTNDGLTTLQQRTSQIQTVVTAIDVEVQNLSGLVAGFTTGVEDSQSAFNSIQIATEEVVQIGLTITKSSTEIADAAGSTASYISEIALLADRTANLTRSARQQSEAMGYQAQQLLQGIQFFRLPENSAPVYTSPAYTESDISTNTFVDYSSPEDSNLKSNLETSEDKGNGGLGLVVPAIGLAAATFAISQSGQSNPQEFSDADLGIDLGSVQDQDFILDSDDLVPDSLISDSLVQDNLVSDNLISEDGSTSIFLDATHDEPAESVYSSLTDISVIEASLFADLKHETYAEDSFDQDIDNYTDHVEYTEESLSVDNEITLKNPMDGVDELAIEEATSDPIVASATYSFLEDTTLGSPSSLSEEVLANLPTSFDFSVPDLDYIDYNDDTFEVPETTLESPLEEVDSFFDADLDLNQQVEEPDLGFDAFNPEEPEIASGEYSDEQYFSNDYALDEIPQGDVQFDDPFENLDLSQTAYATGLSGFTFAKSSPNLDISENFFDDADLSQNVDEFASPVMPFDIALGIEDEELSTESFALELPIATNSDIQDDIQENVAIAETSILGVSELLELPIDSSATFSFDVDEDVSNISTVSDEADNFFNTEFTDADSAQEFNPEITEETAAVANPFLNPLDEIYGDEISATETSFPSLFDSVTFDEDESLDEEYADDDEYADDFAWQAEAANADLNVNLNVNLNADLIPSIDMSDSEQDSPETEMLDVELPDFTAIADSDELELTESPELPTDVNLPVSLDDSPVMANSGLDLLDLSDMPNIPETFNFLESDSDSEFDLASDSVLAIGDAIGDAFTDETLSEPLNETLNETFTEPEFSEPEFSFDLLDEDSDEFDAFQQPIEEVAFDAFDSLLSDDEGFNESDPFSEISVMASDNSLLDTDGFTEAIAPDITSDIAPDIESVTFDKIWESSSIDQNDDLGYEESAIFGVVSNDLEDSPSPETPEEFGYDDSSIFDSLASDLDDYSLENSLENYVLDDSDADLDLSTNSLGEVLDVTTFNIENSNIENSNIDSNIDFATAPDIAPNTDNLQVEPESTEDTPDFSIDLSDDWLTGIVDEEPASEDDFSAIAEGISGISADSSYGFADDLLNSLMDESGENDLSMDLSEISKDTSESKLNFDFSASNAPINSVDSLAKDPVVKVKTARDEIEDFLSGNFDLDQPV